MQYVEPLSPFHGASQYSRIMVKIKHKAKFLTTYELHHMKCDLVRRSVSLVWVHEVTLLLNCWARPAIFIVYHISIDLTDEVTCSHLPDCLKPGLEQACHTLPWSHDSHMTLDDPLWNELDKFTTPEPTVYCVLHTVSFPTAEG